MDGRVRTAVIWAGCLAGTGQAGARIADAVVVGAYCVVGAVVLAARPRHRVGRLLVAGGVLWGAASLPLELLVAHLAQHPEETGWVAAAVAAFTLRGFGFFLLLGVLPLVFPDGRLPSPRWRRPVRLLLAAFAVTFVVGGLFSRGNLDERLGTLPNPLSPPAWVPVLDLVALLSLLLLAVTVLLGGVALVGRWRRGDARLRQQVGWVVAALSLAVPAGVVIAAGFDQAGIWSAAAAPLPVGIGVAVLQHRLYAIDLLVNRTLRYVVLVAAVVVLYVLVVAGVGAMLQVRGSPWVAAGAAAVVAVASAPLHRVVRRGVNRLVYGAWDEPSTVLDRLGARLAVGAGGAPADVLPELAASLALSFLAVVDRDGVTLATTGTPSAACRSLPLVHRGVPIGTLWAGPPARRGARGERLLAALAHQLAPSVAAAVLTDDLQRSRERLVTSREEERRRLRRDLHDGVGPALAALALRVDTARNTVGADPEVDAVLLSLRHDVQETVSDVRRVVDDLRPPALDEVGLAGAVHRLVDRFAGMGIEVAVGELPELPAAVEVAAYRIVQEALTNVVRHAGARCCRVELGVVELGVVELGVVGPGVVGPGVVGPGRAGRVLRIRVADDGAGAGARAPGNGLVTMRERAEEIGGTFELTDAAPGTVVVAALPLQVST